MDSAHPRGGSGLGYGRLPRDQPETRQKAEEPRQSGKEEGSYQGVRGQADTHCRHSGTACRREVQDHD